MSPAAGVSTVPATDAASQHVAFRAGGFLLLGALDSIEEITEIMALNPVPGTVDWFLGLGARKGQLLPVSEFSGYLGAAESAAGNQRLLVINRGGESFGLVVDDVLGLMEQDQMDGDAAVVTTDSMLPARLAPLFKASVALGENTAAVVDLTLLLDQKSFVSIEAEA